MIHVGILTLSDRSARGEREDFSGPALASMVVAQGWKVAKQLILPDDFEQIKTTLVEWVNSGEIDILLTTGGTGFSPRDVTPEATLAVVERSAPGLAEAMRQAGMQKTPHAMLSRAVAGISKKTLIINLPGNPNAAVESLTAIQPSLPHAVDLLNGTESDQHSL